MGTSLAKLAFTSIVPLAFTSIVPLTFTFPVNLGFDGTWLIPRGFFRPTGFFRSTGSSDQRVLPIRFGPIYGKLFSEKPRLSPALTSPGNIMRGCGREAALRPPAPLWTFWRPGRRNRWASVTCFRVWQKATACHGQRFINMACHRQRLIKTPAGFRTGGQTRPSA